MMSESLHTALLATAWAGARSETRVATAGQGRDEAQSPPSETTAAPSLPRPPGDAASLATGTCSREEGAVATWSWRV